MTGIAAPLGTMTVDRDRAPAWGAIYALSLCKFTLVASEFMPISLLSPIAHTLNLTEGQAGQAISISGIFAVLASLSMSSLIGSLDRRHVLLGLTALLIMSGTLVAFAPSYLVLMIGRAFVASQSEASGRCRPPPSFGWCPKHRCPRAWRSSTAARRSSPRAAPVSSCQVLPHAPRPMIATWSYGRGAAGRRTGLK